MIHALLSHRRPGYLLALNYPPIVIHWPRVRAHLTVATGASRIVIVESVKRSAVAFMVMDSFTHISGGRDCRRRRALNTQPQF